MRIWDIDPAKLCDNHLRGEHRELHAIWNILAQNKQGYRHHPEVKRWEGKLAALFLRHEAQVVEMTARGWNHASPLDERKATGRRVQTKFVHTPAQQREIIAGKGCDCDVARGR